jgi:hypothetical protein
LALTAGAAAQFETRATVSVTVSPHSIAVGDFNRDGKLDVALVGGDLQVLLGNGDGTFKTPVTYLIGHGVTLETIATADFNHDGKLDLAVADSLGVSILLGNGDGTFQAPVNYGPFPVTQDYIAVGDFNGDHNLDVVTSGNPYVSVLLGNGDATFQQPINTGPMTAEPIGIGDFNRDGKLDVAVGQSLGGTSKVQILLGNGDGTFALGGSYTIGGDSTSIAVADFNGDKKLDLAVSSLTHGTDVLLGNGDGTFQSASTYPTGSNFVAACDFNRDGKLDLASAQLDFPSGVFVRLGNGDGMFGPASYYADGKEDWSVAAGDFNGDHYPDLVVVDYLSNAVITMLNTGVARFSPNTPLSFPAQLVGSVSAAQTITLTNTGKTTLSISSMRATSPFQLDSGTTCATPGRNCTLSIDFRPTAIGFRGGMLVLSDSASSKPQVIELSGSGTVISLSPPQLNFGSQKVGTKSAPQNVTVTNTGSKTVDVTNVKIAGSDPKDYSETNTCGNQIGPGANCTISVTFAPTKTGTRTAEAQINDNGGGSPQTVFLSGIGD